MKWQNPILPYLSSRAFSVPWRKAGYQQQEPGRHRCHPAECSLDSSSGSAAGTNSAPPTPTGFASPSSDHSPSCSHFMNHVTGQKKLKLCINFCPLCTASNMCSSGNFSLWMPGPRILPSLGIRYIKSGEMAAVVGM